MVAIWNRANPLFVGDAMDHLFVAVDAYLSVAVVVRLASPDKTRSLPLGIGEQSILSASHVLTDRYPTLSAFLFALAMSIAERTITGWSPAMAVAHGEKGITWL